MYSYQKNYRGYLPPQSSSPFEAPAFSYQPRGYRSVQGQRLDRRFGQRIPSGVNGLTSDKSIASPVSSSSD